MLMCEVKSVGNGNAILVTSDGLEIMVMLPMGEQIDR